MRKIVMTESAEAATSSPKLAITYNELLALAPCESGKKRIVDAFGGTWASPIDARCARKFGATMQDIIWVATQLTKTDPIIASRLRLFAADCAARVLPLYEKKHSATSPRNAIIAARAFARGEIGKEELRRASASAYAAAYAAYASAAYAAYASAVYDAAASAAAAAVYAASASAYASAASASAAYAASDAEKAWQFDRLIARLSDEEINDWPI
jgi:hypothetical protein